MYGNLARNGDGANALSLKIGTIIIFLITVRLNEGLRLTNMSVPHIVDYRKTMDIDCQFDMGGEELYAVKWYKDEHEFFRYMPHQQPHIMLFPAPGINLRHDETDCGQTRCLIHFHKLEKIRSGGAYRCEVSSEAPAFRLASETHNVTVAAVPSSNPYLEGLEDGYYEGDILNSKCITSPSDPAQEITWFINNEQAPSKFVRDTKITRHSSTGQDSTELLSSSQLLRFVVEARHVQNSTATTTASGKRTVRLRCVATLPGTTGSTVAAVTLTVERSVVVLDHTATQQEINNQKFYWYSSRGSCGGGAAGWRVVVMVAVGLVWCLVQKL